MISMVRRAFVEKKPGFDVEARALLTDLKENLGMAELRSVRVVNRYDVAGLSEEEYALARDNVFFEPPVDLLYEEVLPYTGSEQIFAVEYLPGQYDQRADSAAQCIQLLTHREQPLVAAAKVIVLDGALSAADIDRVKAYLINPVESREAALDKPNDLASASPDPEPVPVLSGFIGMTGAELSMLHREYGLAMSMADLQFCQEYFRDTEDRNPTVTELRVIDTYWSDHCRHTTFLTVLNNVSIEESPLTRPIAAAWEEYQTIRRDLYGDDQRDLSLMDVAIIGMKELRRQGRLDDLDASEEINAASIRVTATVNGQLEEWLVMFKNETHNHPTEIEPFGGAATCLGGAIRDPLSGRVYVYQAMRVTGSGDPRTAIKDTLPGKLPQRKITTGAAAGYSSYGNQIGLATGQVAEIYDEGYVAKRMEIGAVIGAAPRYNVVRSRPQPGDLVVLLGGRTGRDGCGGATGSSKAHTENSLSECGAEVQKGNPPTERKIQRLFRNPVVSRLIKRCNDFGAGGVSVAIGELAEGLEINLDAVPKKYDGLDGTELAISESQERMAVVVAAADLDALLGAAAKENLEATVVARVTAAPRLRMAWRGIGIVDLSRSFLDTNGVKQRADVIIQAPASATPYGEGVDAAGNLPRRWLENLGRLNVCSQRGLGERFDGSIGAGTVLMPYGGQHQLTPVQGMAAKLPVYGGDTDTATVMTFGCIPAISRWSPFHGAAYAVVEALAKMTAMGADYRKARLTLQEYFEKLGTDPVKWGRPFSALLGALHAQLAFGTPAIGGKDSMSGTFNELSVPPTLAAFAVGIFDPAHAVSPEFKAVDDAVVLLPAPVGEDGLQDFAKLQKNWEKVLELIVDGKIAAARAISTGGTAAAISEMAFGNMIGIRLALSLDASRLFRPEHGAIVLELAAGRSPASLLADVEYIELGVTQAKEAISFGADELELTQALAAWSAPLSGIFPDHAPEPAGLPPVYEFRKNIRNRVSSRLARPRVLIPVFPGTNCEYDSAAAFERAGASAEILVVRNRSAADIEETIRNLAAGIRGAQIVMLPGGFSAGDEPDGSGKFIAAMFRNPRVKEAVDELLKVRDGLMLGICNGFQALIKLGLVPYGEIVDYCPDSPTLTYNLVGRHVSRYVCTRIASNLSPWLSEVEVGDIHAVPVSHGEGRFIAPAAMIERLAQHGQIATQYVDLEGIPSYKYDVNPNGSAAAIEGITSPDGRVLGKMAHSERIGRNVARNILGTKDQKIFQAGVKYFC